MKHLVLNSFGLFLGLKSERLVVYKNKEIIKAFFNNFFGFNDESELKTHLNKINFKEEKFNEEKAKESIRGG